MTCDFCIRFIRSHTLQALALECERLRSTGSSAGMTEAISDMSQAFFSAADMHASLGHMPMASSMCVAAMRLSVAFCPHFVPCALAARVSSQLRADFILRIAIFTTPARPCRCFQLAAQLRSFNFFADAAAAYLRAAQCVQLHVMPHHHPLAGTTFHSCIPDAPRKYSLPPGCRL